ncbi:MAG: sensor histidine kinase KdpD [Deltaproteobacteria bacterium]|nr:sensor histidine kinase KdpD [Deltaproteobacteria bacterium]
MTAEEQRPDPDQLLRRIQSEEQRALRARLKVFFGFAPGVGKTYRMLRVARDLRDEGVDVVVGVVETHRRAETASLLEGLPTVARKKVSHRGRQLDELDLDAVLARKPKVVLVDELAHTNAPGSRHPKRWQDVLELLEAGIDVFTTVNVQHVESLNDVVAQITNVQVRETVPDSVLERADEIEVIDIPPEELLARLAEGKVYLPDQAERAKAHFFRKGNLLALRELALRRVAQHVDEDVREYRAAHGVEETWPASERVLVCVGPSPGSDRVIREGYRMAAGLRAPWVAVYVESIERTSDRARLEGHLRLAESLGASVVRLEGLRVADAVLAYSRQHNVTRLLVGKPTHSRWLDRLRGSLLDDIVRGSGEIDVQVIGGKSEAEPRGLDEVEDERASPTAYLLAAVLVAAVTGISLGLAHAFRVPDLEVLFLVAVLVAAIRLGRGPAVLAAALGVAAYDFFLVPPRFTFAVADTRYVLTFAMMFGVGLLVSELTARIRRQERGAIHRESRTAALYALSRDLGAADDLGSSANAVVRHAGQLFDARAFLLLPGTDGVPSLVASHPEGAVLDPKEHGVAGWAFDHARVAGLGTDTLPGSSTLSAPLVAGTSIVGVLAIEPRSARGLDREPREWLDALARQAAFALARLRLSEEARSAALRAKTEELRSSLLSAVSHDLRTPLAAITGAASTLRADPTLPRDTHDELVTSICDQAVRLERLVANLLDMTRLDSGSVELVREWVPIEEVIVAAIAQLETRLGDRAVRLDVPADVPLVSVDPVLLEQLFVNLLENATKYAGESALDITARADAGALTVVVGDRGPGLVPGSEERVFERFQRGRHEGVTGVGLGLPICRAICEAHGGSIRASNREGGGAIFTITLPLIGTPPSLAAPEPLEGAR